jgi:hypothetical protein
MVKSKAYWYKLARHEAQVNHDSNFPSRRGIYHFEDLDVLLVYNNNPWADDPERRERETTAFREVLEKNGIKELAYATYPLTGADAGYSYAMVIDASHDRERFLADAMLEIVRRELVA